MHRFLLYCCPFALLAILCDSIPIDERAPSPVNTRPGSLTLYPDSVIPNLPSNLSPPGSSNASTLGDVGEPIPIGFEVHFLPVPRTSTTSQAFWDLMLQALAQFAMSDYAGQSYPCSFHNPKFAYNTYAMSVYGYSQSSPRTLSTIKNKLALWGLLRVLERVSGLEQWTAVKAEFYLDGKILGGLHFDFRDKFPVLGNDTVSLFGEDNTAVGSGSSPLVLASDPSISAGSSSSSSSSSSNSEELTFISSTASNVTHVAPLANVTSSASSLANTYGRTELIPHYGPTALTAHQIIVSYARALAIGGLAVPPKSDRPPPSIKFNYQDLQTSVYFEKAAPMAALPVWTYEWIITAISHVPMETWAVPHRGLYSCVYDVKVDGILLGYVGIGPLR